MRRVPASALVGALTAALAALVPPAPASAHLCIVRQGNESRGASEAGDRHGESLAVGDFNGDGFDDLAMGAPLEDISGGFTDAGAVVVSFGSPTGITHVGGLLITEGDYGGANESNAEFGAALAAGDFDGDGLDDLVIGVPGATTFGLIADVGEVYVLRGHPSSGLVAWHILHQSDAGGASEGGDRFGEALAVGNFNNDASPVREDLAVGAPGEDAAAGAVFYFTGTATGPTGASGFFKQSSFGQTDVAGDRFGHAIAAGKLVADGADDLVVGAPYRDLPTSDAGRVYLIPGEFATGLQATATMYDAADVDSRSIGGRFGQALAAGTFTGGHGYEALAIGEPGHGTADWLDTGRVVLFTGTVAGLDRTSEKILLGVVFTGTIADFDEFGSSLAAGQFGVADSFDDLAIGSPLLSLGSGTNTGMVVIAYGAGGGPTSSAYERWDQADLNDAIEQQEELGASVAFGDFDGSGRGALAAGAPGEDALAGQVHIVAPWRQVLGLRCRTSALFDCGGELIFSQKPFEHVYPASTTKIMSTLLACERASLPPSDPQYVDLEQVYAVPAWITDEVGGTNVLQPGETITLRNLLYLSMMLSGNDAAYAIGDILEGNGLPSGIPDFAAAMNTRAAQLGMTRTNFTNAAGLTYEVTGPPPAGEHRTTAEDMLKLTHAAMQNSLFASIAGTKSRNIFRTYPGTAASFHYKNIINWVIDLPSFPRGNGVKSGSGTTSQFTTVTSAEVTPTTNVIASTFYSPFALGNEVAHEDALDLLVLGLGACGIEEAWEPWADHLYLLEAISTHLGDQTGGGVEFRGSVGGDMEFNFAADAGSPSTTADIEIRRVSELLVGGFLAEGFGVVPFGGHGEIRFQNLGNELTNFDVTVDYEPVSSDVVHFSLDPGEIGTIPAYGGPDADEFHMTVTNVSVFASVPVSIEETYTFGATIGSGPEAFRALMPRGTRTTADYFEVVVTGTDPTPGRTIRALWSEAGTVVSVGDPTPSVAAGLAGPIRFASAVPNPVASTALKTRIAFDLAEPGRVIASILDVQGRRVRELTDAEFPAGRHALEWDGRGDDGTRIPAGIYFVRLELEDGGSAHGRIVLLP